MMMMDRKEWQDYSRVLKELLNLEYSPVAINCIKEVSLKEGEKKVRICRAILDAGKGAILEIDKQNNACFGVGFS